jgi:hypothetical protein
MWGVTNDTGDGAREASLSSEMIHQFMYPKVTPVKPGAGGRGGMLSGAAKPGAASRPGTARRTA